MSKPAAIECSEPINTTMGPVFGWLPVEENVPHAPTMAFFGKRRTGKSTTIKNIAFHLMQHIPFGIVMSNTSFTGDWADIVPKKFIVQGLRQDVIDWLINRQKKLIRKYGDEKHPAVQAFIILDDVIADQKAIRWSADLNGFFVEGRHLGITVLIASQYVKGVGPMVRGNLDYTFLQPIYNKAQRDTLWDMECAFIEKKEWGALMDEVIVRELLPGSTAAEPKKKIRIMVVADFEDTPIIQEKNFHWTPVFAGDLPTYRLCHPVYWQDNDRAQISAMAEIEEKVDMADVIRSVSCLE